MKRQTAIIAGGGTGGHLYPAVSIARALQKLAPDLEIHFVGSYRGLENKIVPREGFPLHRVPIEGLSRVGIVQTIKTLVLLPFAFLKSLWLLLYLRPKFVLGVGGYASGPILMMAALLRMRTFIWEPNAHPGMANRLLARFVNRVFIVFEETRKFLVSKNIQVSGLPIRNVMVPVPSGALKNGEPLRIFITGGSQGARGINKRIVEAVTKGHKENAAWLNQVEIVHQTGSADFAEVNKAYLQTGLPNVKAHEYVHDMPEQYRKANVVFCRSGASTIAELAACQKAAVLIPLPTAADDHQRKNAESLTGRQAAILVLQSEFDGDKFVELVQRLKTDLNLIPDLEKKISCFHKAEADLLIAKVLLGERQ